MTVSLDEETQMIAQKLSVALMFAVVSLPPHAQADGPIEPNAGNWRTWVISSGRDYRVPPPPGHAETQAELRSLDELISHNNAQTRQQIAFWDAGDPAYRWLDMIHSRLNAGVATSAYPHRVYTYVTQ